VNLEHAAAAATSCNQQGTHTGLGSREYVRMRVSGCAIWTVTVGNVEGKISIRGHRGGNRRVENTTGRGASGFVLNGIGLRVIT